MKKIRSIQHIVQAQKVNMGGFIVEQALPNHQIQMMDPFLLIHHADKHFPPGGNERAMGVGPHPHRGFSPVTLVLKGNVHHRDSRGNDSIVEAGGVQWMNAGRGIIHSERPSKTLANDGGQMEIIQFWVNQQARFKMETPSYFPLSSDMIPEFTLQDNVGKAKVITGEFGDLKGPISSKTDMLILLLDINSNSTVDIPIPEQFNVALYLISGALSMDEKIKQKTLLVFNGDGRVIHVASESASKMLLLAGTPIKEKVVTHGPYVMNTETEIWEAMRDYTMGKMGYLVEEFD